MEAFEEGLAGRGRRALEVARHRFGVDTHRVQKPAESPGPVADEDPMVVEKEVEATDSCAVAHGDEPALPSVPENETRGTGNVSGRVEPMAPIDSKDQLGIRAGAASLPGQLPMIGDEAAEPQAADPFIG
jgi:hypothetical protein